MSAPSAAERPKLRAVERIELDREGEALVVLRDPLGVAEPVALDAEFVPVLDLLDGTRSPAQIRQSLLMRGSMSLPLEELASFVADLEEAGLLHGPRFEAMWGLIHQDFLEQEVRAARMAGILYPDDASALSAHLDEAIGSIELEADGDDNRLLGVMVPHQPPARVGALLGRTLSPLPDPSGVDLIVLLGTDHTPGLTPYALTDKDYDTPLGPVRTHVPLVDAFEQRLPWIRREEIRHRQATSLELAAVLLRHAYADRCPPVLPLLCGASGLTTVDGRVDREEFLAVAEALLGDRRVLWWASAELSHAGVAYGRPALGPDGLSRVEDHDRSCLLPLLSGRPDQVAARCMEPFDQGRPSGTAVMDTLAHLLPVGYRAELSDYRALHVPGDDDGAVGAAGLRFLA